MRAVSFVERLQFHFNGNIAKNALVLGDVDNDNSRPRDPRTVKPWSSCQNYIMRAVSFVERLQFDFNGNIAKNALVLGDVDNDNANELVVANIVGDLAVFKGRQCKPWAQAEDLGMTTCIVIGDIFNEKKNYLTCISSEGWCNIFHVNEDCPLKDGKRKLIPIHTQRLPANAKDAILADIDQDGCVELILGLTDRVVRTYRWVDLGLSSLDPKGKLVGIHKWEFVHQIGSISVNTLLDGSSNILVAQPGGTYVSLKCLINEGDLEEEEGGDSINPSFNSKLTREYHGLASSRMRNHNISSEILGDIRGGTKDGQPTSSLLAVATLDGTLMLVDGDQILWSLQVDYQPFALTKLDLTGDGFHEVIACAWDGQTYIVNQQRQSVRFQFEEHVSSFTAGVYNLDSSTDMPCFVYATFSNCIYLYHNISLSAIKTQSFRDILDKDKNVTELLERLNVKKGSDEERELYRWCLYQYPSFLKQIEPNENE